MNTSLPSRLSRLGSACWVTLLALGALLGAVTPAKAAPAPLLFSDDFGIPGWTSVQPAYGAWQGTVPIWGYDAATDQLFENSNIYSDTANNAPNRMAVMLINDTVAPAAGYEYKVRMTAPDDDGLGVIFGYQDEKNFYRFEMSRQPLVGRQVDWPWQGWSVDRMANSQPVDLFGVGSANPPIQGWNAWTNTASVAFDVVVAVTNDRLWVTITNNPTVTLVANSASATGAFTDGTGYLANDTVTVRVYGFKIINNRQIFSATPATSAVVTSNNVFNVNWSWAAVSAAAGYRLVRSTNGEAFDYYTDVPATLTFLDDNTLWTNGVPTMPSKEFYFMVTNGLLPTVAGGKVGIFSWGQSATAPAYGMTASLRSLSPTPLAGNLTQFAGVWTNIVTTGAAGATAWGSPPPVWYRSLGSTPVNGLSTNGTMIDISDAIPDNTTAIQVDFRSSATVAGNPAWTNYFFTTRMLNTDDDGWGFFLRFLNRSNFYRVAFRRQTAAGGAPITTGVKTGVSMQQSINNVFTEITNSTGLPTTAWVVQQNLPVEINCLIRTQSIYLQLVTDPDGARIATNLGPYNVYGTTLPAGKIGLMGWAEANNYWDYVKVYSMTTGEVLSVISPYGTATPAAGVHDLPNGSTVSGATVTTPFTDGEGKQHVCLGWRATGGSIQTSGTSNTVPNFLMTSGITRLEWVWGTIFNLTVIATPGGTANFIGTMNIVEGTTTNLVATNFPGYVFTGWSGLPTAAVTTNLALTVTRTLTVVANFAVDSDNDGLPDAWENYYFGDLTQGPAGDPDGDGKSNLAEYQLGTNPGATEQLVASDGLSSRWSNVSRDRAIPGWYKIAELGTGFRGLYEDSDQYRYANAPGISGAGYWDGVTYAQNASFQSTAIVIKTNDYNPALSTNFIFSSEYSVGDNDGICVYFRYKDEYNYYRFTLCGQATDAANIRPIIGASIQMRSNGIFSLITPLTDTGATGYMLDPTDVAWYKRSLITVAGTNDTFEYRMKGWQGGSFSGVERVMTFVNPTHTNGTMGLGVWAMGNFGSVNTTADNPVGRGAFIDNIVITNNDVQVFAEDWEAISLSTNLPAGWTNVYSGSVPLRGDWEVTAHGTIGQLADAAAGGAQTGIGGAPKADVDAPLILAPALTNLNYTLEIGILPYDDGGMGFVYDYVDNDNFSRVLFDNRPVAAGVLTPGLNISRKSGGVWTDVVIGDTNFVYTPGRAFDVRFGNNNGSYSLTAANSDVPGTVYRWHWTNAPANSPQYGLSVWRMPDAHYTYVRAYGIADPVLPLKFSAVSTSSGNIVLDIQNGGGNYVVLRSSDVTLPLTNWTRLTTNNIPQYTEGLSGPGAFYYSLQRAP